MFEPKLKNGRPVTNERLEERLRSFRWEVRFWVVVAIAAAQFAPIAKDTAQAAIRVLPW